MKAIKKLLTVLLAVCLLFTGSISYAATDENNVGGGTGNPDGAATAGKASYTALSQMWKISVYVAKRDTVTHSSEYTLTEDYHKFGYTFWLYRDGYGVQQIAEAGVSLDNLYMELNNKEEYNNQNASFTQAKYNSVKDRVFKGSDHGLIMDNVVPLINNFGADSIQDTKDFFDSNKTVSNIVVKLAAKAAGTTPEAILSELEFTINGETKTGWDLKMVDVRTDSNASGKHTSCVSWVFLYEPVIVINGTNITGYRHAVTATGIAAAMKQGIYNWTSSENDYLLRFKSSSERPATIPSVPWGLGTNFPLVLMPNSAYLSEDWLGYKTGEYWQNLSSGQTWYVNEQLAGGGFGMRYQRAEIPKVVIQKTVNDSSIGDLSGFTFTVTSNSTGEQWTSTTNTEGKVTLYLPAGAYTLTESNVPGYEEATSKSFVVPTTATKDTVINVSFNNVMKVGTLEVSKVAEDNEYSQTSFTFSSSDYEDFTISLTDTTSGTLTVNAKEGLSHLNLTFSITNGTLSGSTCRKITLYGLPLGDWTVTENRPARYGETYVGYVGSGQMESLSFTATVTESTTSSIRFDNFLQTYSLSIVKRIKAEDIIWAHGNPTFFFRVNSITLKYTPGAMGTAGTTKQIVVNTYYSMEFTQEYVDTYLTANPGAEYVEMTLDIPDFAVNSFNSVSEMEVMRYKLAENGIEMREGTGTVYSTSASVNISSGNPHPVVSFTNDKVDQQGCSSNSIVINEFKIGE